MVVSPLYLSLVRPPTVYPITIICECVLLKMEGVQIWSFAKMQNMVVGSNISKIVTGFYRICLVRKV